MTADADAAHDGAATWEGHSDRWDLASVVEPHEGKPDRRTVFPADVAGVDICTHWFSADDASFVTLAEMR
jgi:hypothetical protein